MYDESDSYLPGNIFTVSTHGYANDQSNIYGPEGMPISVEAAGNYILSSYWDRKTPIELDICYAGNGGTNSFAAQLAQYLANRTGTVVTITATPNQSELTGWKWLGNYFGGNIAPGPGGWQTFSRSPQQ